MDDSPITCAVIIESYDEDADANAEAKSNDKTKSNDEVKSYDETNFNKKKATRQTQNFYFLLTFLLITIVLLILVSICCYLIKY